MSNLDSFISPSRTSVSLNTMDFFDENGEAFHQKKISPIDSFLYEHESLRRNLGRLYSQDTYSDQINNLLLLGFVSSVESYLRNLVIEIINKDDFSWRKSLNRKISFAAACHKKNRLVVAAMLEECNFLSKNDIVDHLKDYLGVAYQDSKSPELADILGYYSQVCQIRHCIVHRASYFGTKNAVSLGLKEHKVFLDRQIVVSIGLLQEVSLICKNLVILVNKYVFNYIMERTQGKNKGVLIWSNDYSKDRKVFNDYYKIFSSNKLAEDGEVELKKASEVYREMLGGS
ncbi:hypothetical protein [Modicisalibacter xianhensis]|uniref:RiboL-PSP-HEPN domain-containing protein n=1 Tax=Modicisalibacter xianhensis TaxID=442341 RepID=A0A1I3GFN6_9GAMM|nr:hypothetical protein [Halomonas xianhensis]SFI22052.1 hypothetical protein SAMN04487959_1312 [Halomonas xianhensis]